MARLDGGCSIYHVETHNGLLEMTNTGARNTPSQQADKWCRAGPVLLIELKQKGILFIPTYQGPSDSPLILDGLVRLRNDTEWSVKGRVQPVYLVRGKN